MEYSIKRGDEQFGPYSLSGLQQYLRSGNLYANDLVRSEGMAEWVPLSEVLGTVPVPPAPVYGEAAAASQAQETQSHLVKLPPNLPWWVLLILVIVTREFFVFVWAIVLANWARKISGKNNLLVLAAMYPVAAFVGGYLMGLSKLQDNNSFLMTGGALLVIAAVIVYFPMIYGIRSEMETYYNRVEKIGLSLSGVMVFFFGVIYLQYHVNSISKIKRLVAGV